MFRKKGVLLVLCLVFVFSMVFLYGDEDEIQRLRAQGQREGWTFTVGKTSVSDIPLEQLCGLKIPYNWRQMGKFEDDHFIRQTLATPPASWDWRDYGKVTPVKNQGSCGSCWAFGMLGSYEAILAINDQGLNNLSEQFLVRCNSYGYGCNGGWWCYDDMYDGIPLESCYPYTATDGSCNYSCTLYFPVEDWFYVGSSSGVPSTSELKQAIYDHGPISVAVYVNSAFQNYTGGIFNSCANYSPNHAVVLVGWDDSGGYWIMKNSWGSGWGEEGYMRITYGCSRIGYAASYAIPESGVPPEEAPAAPSKLRGSASRTSVTLTWTDNSNNEDGFYIYRGLTSSSLSLIATVGANVTTYTNSGLSRRTRYYYKVCAYNSYGENCSSTISVRTR
jgi:hypothetical protein